jgi:type VI secretion system secreted protein VgrG
MLVLWCAVSVKATTLGTAASFAVLGASTVTNTGSTVLNGNLGLYPGTSITGFGPGIVNGTIDATNGVAEQAQADALTFYNVLAGQAATGGDLSGENLGGQTLFPGVYKFDSSAQLTGPLTLNAEGENDAVFVFQIGSTLTTASASSVDIINPGSDDSIYWQVGSSATLGTTTAFYGSILADASVTLDTGATITCGRAVALNAAVTMDDNTISTGNCAAPAGGTGGNGNTPIPEPGTLSLLALGLSGITFLRSKSKRGPPILRSASLP